MLLTLPFLCFSVLLPPSFQKSLFPKTGSSMAPSTTMALVTLCLLSFIGIAYSSAVQNNFIVQGRVYCDTCRIGFETPVTTYMGGATVKVECRDRATGFLTYSTQGMTDATGTYHIPVANDHQKEMCEAVLVNSPQRGCTTIEMGRERAGVVITHNNGIPANIRFANALGFVADRPLAVCAEVLKQYEFDDINV